MSAEKKYPRMALEAAGFAVRRRPLRVELRVALTEIDHLNAALDRLRVGGVAERGSCVARGGSDSRGDADVNEELPPCDETFDIGPFRFECMGHIPVHKRSNITGRECCEHARKHSLDSLSSACYHQVMTTNECSGFIYPINPDAPEEGTDIRHETTCDLHDVVVREVVVWGWDGVSNPIYAYRDELKLPRWQHTTPTAIDIERARG